MTVLVAIHLTATPSRTLLLMMMAEPGRAPRRLKLKKNGSIDPTDELACESGVLCDESGNPFDIPKVS
jgi:hypothetical protein